MKPWDIFEQLVDLVMEQNPTELAARTLRAVAGFTGGNRAALFERHKDGFRLFASRGVDQEVLDLLDRISKTRGAELSAGKAIVLQKRPGAADAVFAEATSLVIHPVMEGPKILGLLYADSLLPRFTSQDDLHAIGQFGRLAGEAIVRYYSASPPSTKVSELVSIEDLEREHLLVALERHEWNIARVARLLGVTRPTIYARLERYGIPRRRPSRDGKRQPA